MCSRGNARTAYYFMFERCSKPLTPQQAKRIIVDFTSHVVSAINEIHNALIAHLDIRLENICFKDDDVALIDFDRSQRTTNMAKFLQSSWGSSVMYTLPDPDSDWTVDKMDWRQLAIMILAILNDTPAEQYHLEPTNFRHAFFHKMYTEG